MSVGLQSRLPAAMDPRVHCSMTAVAYEQHPLCGQKRPRSAIEEEHSTSAKPHSPRLLLQQEDNTKNFWDFLSKVWLTPNALEELDRRNRLWANSIKSTVPPRQDLGDGQVASQDLKRFARHGGPDLRDLRGYREPPISVSPANDMASNQPSPREGTNAIDETPTSTSKKSRPYDGNFEQILVDGHIFPSGYEFPDGRDTPKPSNLKDIYEMLKDPRPSLDESNFSDEDFNKFRRAINRASNELAVTSDVFPSICGSANILSGKNVQYSNLEPMPLLSVTKGQPDFYDGVPAAQVNRRIRDEIGKFIVPNVDYPHPILPNFFADVKGRKGTLGVATRQACYDGALGARGIHELRSFHADPALAYDNNAYTITSIYIDGVIRMYTTHPTRATSAGVPCDYYMTYIKGWMIEDSPEAFREGVTAFRNARDWAKKQRDEVIAKANARVTGMP